MKYIKHSIKKSIVLFFIFSTHFVFAQNYFQQEVNYTIQVKLNDSLHTLDASEQIVYKNNSPHTLNEIYMHIWPNAYKNNQTALARQLTEAGQLNFRNAKESDRGYIDKLDFKVDGVKADWTYDPEHIDICIIKLAKPLNPGESITISTPFHVKIPLGVYSRLGHLDQAYQITQWYPKPAVYDKNGWNSMPYLNQGEFYSEFGSFDVSIIVPKNYVVGATGDLQDGEAETAWLLEKVKETEAKTEFRKEDDKFPASSKEWKTLRYKQTNVHDFAWFADKRFNVLKGEVELPHSKRKVDTWSMFLNAEAGLWKKSITYLNDAVYYYSLWNGDYPYNHATAVDGALTAGGGMEYPNITVIGTAGNDETLETVIMHEVGHNWFYGILGSNERQHPWLDEGLNSYNELRYNRTKYPDRKLLGSMAGSKLGKFVNLDKHSQEAQYDLAYLLNARRNMDQPIEFPAAEYTQLNYAGVVYSKTAIAFDYLRAYLGEDLMDKTMKAYFEKWKFKHPTPADLEQVFKEQTNKNLDWFFKDMIPTTKKLDYKIVKVGRDNNLPVITVKNTGDIKGPFSIFGIKDSLIKASIWYDGIEGTGDFSFPPGDYDLFIIDAAGEMPEVNRKNNTIKTNGIFKRVEPLQLKLIGELEDPSRTQIFYTPLAGYNCNDGFMAGLGVYGSVIPQTKFEYVLAPLYSFKENKVRGIGEIAYNIFPENNFKRIRISMLAKSFGAFDYMSKTDGDQTVATYLKLQPKVTFELNQKNERSFYKRTLSLRSVYVSHDYEGIQFNQYLSNYHFDELAFRIEGNRSVNPFGMEIKIQAGQLINQSNYEPQFHRQSIELYHRFSFKKKNKGLSLRIFAGNKFTGSNATLTPAFVLDKQVDYLYDDLAFCRWDGQLVNSEGGFKTLVGVTSDKWLASFNAECSIVSVLFAFADVGTTDLLTEGKLAGVSGKLAYDAGLGLSIIDRIFKVYFPLTAYPEVKGLDYAEKIRFTLTFNALNPFAVARNFNQ